MNKDIGSLKTKTKCNTLNETKNTIEKMSDLYNREMKQIKKYFPY